MARWGQDGRLGFCVFLFYFDFSNLCVYLFYFLKSVELLLGISWNAFCDFMLFFFLKFSSRKREQKEHGLV